MEVSRTEEGELGGGLSLFSLELVALVDLSPLLKPASSVRVLTQAHPLSWLNSSSRERMCEPLCDQKHIMSQNQPLVAETRTLVHEDILGDCGDMGELQAFCSEMRLN